MKILPYFLLFLLGFSFPLSASPKIECLKPIEDIGKREVRTPFSHKFVIKNNGSEILKIGKLRPCCGAKAEIDKKELKPNEKAEVIFSLTLPSKPGELKKNLFIACNDPKTPYLQLKVTGELYRNYDLESEYIELNIPNGSQNFHKEFKITWNEGKALKNPQVTSSFNWLDTKLAVSSNTWIIKLSGNNIPAQGLHYGNISITSGASQIHIPVHVKVSPDIKLTPSKLSIRNKRNKPIKRLVAIRSKSRKSFLIEPSVKVEGIDIKLSQKSKGVWLASLQFSPEAELPEFITFKSDHEEAKEIKLAIQYFL